MMIFNSNLVGMELFCRTGSKSIGHNHSANWFRMKKSFPLVSTARIVSRFYSNNIRFSLSRSIAVSKFIDQNQLPHLLLYGPPGTGKTTSILACARKLYTAQEFKSKVLELNASDDRGIGIVRGAIMDFASTQTMYSKTFKLIILDEADAMTNDAQNALRRGKCRANRRPVFELNLFFADDKWFRSYFFASR